MSTQPAPPDAFTRLSRALTSIAHGGMALVADDADRENEGDLIMAAQSVSTDDMVFLLRHGSGLVCTPMGDATADRLDLRLMVATNTDNHQTAFTVTVDAETTGTGISAADRAATVRVLANAGTAPGDLRRPGHVFPLRARAGGVLERAGHTEAAVDLMRLAGCRDVAVITELVADDGVPMSGADLSLFATTHRLPMITVGELVEHRRRLESRSMLGASAAIPTRHGVFNAQSHTATDGVEHLVLLHGEIRAAAATATGVLVRVHSECLTGDVIGSRRCDCGSQLDGALAAIAAEGAGVLIYLRGHEGRGIGLGHKLAAYTLQESGRDTIDANIELGVPIDNRDYRVCAAVLHRLGVHRIRLITNNPRKVQALNDGGITVVERVTAPPVVHDDNITYLQTKRDRLGHLLDLPAALP